MKNKAFTLVELAIVMTIIGLLIGGVLKGQELLENARINTAGATIKASTAATLTFRDIYKAMPGDMLNPASFIQNCTAAPCNVSGDGDGTVCGPSGNWCLEVPRYWLHLAKAGLIGGIDPNVTFSGTTYFPTGGLADFAIGGKLTTWYAGAGGVFRSHVYYSVLPTSAGASYDRPVIQTKLMKYDLKFDDGLATQGDIQIYGPHCDSLTSYNPNDSRMCLSIQSAGF